MQGIDSDEGGNQDDNVLFGNPNYSDESSQGIAQMGESFHKTSLLQDRTLLPIFVGQLEALAIAQAAANQEVSASSLIALPLCRCCL